MEELGFYKDQTEYYKRSIKDLLYIELKKQFRYVSPNKVSTAEIMHDLSFEDFLELARDIGCDITKRP